MENRIKFGVNAIEINGVQPTNTKVTNINVEFNLQQCFCSCSLKLPYMYNLIGNHWIEVEEHYDDCPNADPAKFIKYVDRAKV